MTNSSNVPFRMTVGGRMVTLSVLLAFISGSFVYTITSMKNDDFANIDEQGNVIREQPPLK